RATVPAKPERDVTRGRIALLVDLLPCRSMPHVVDRHVILLSPEERHAGKALMVPEHIAGDSLALALRDHPVLDAKPLAALGIGPAGDVPSRENARCARLQALIDQNAMVDREARPLGESQARTYTDPDEHEVGIDQSSIVELDLPGIYCTHCVAKMKHNAVRLVEGANEVSHRGPEDPLHGPSLRRHHVDLRLPLSQCRRRFEPNEACPDDHSTATRLGARDDRPAIGK